MFFISSLLALALQAPIPEQVYRIVQVGGTDGSIAWAVPIGLNRLLTANHVMEPSTATFWVRDGNLRMPLTRTKAFPKIDLALVWLENFVLPPVEVAQKLPKVQDEVFWRCYLSPGEVPTVIRGRYLGKDSDGDLVFDGSIYAGCSGSGVLDVNGRLVGVLKSGLNPSLASSREDRLGRALSFDNFAIAVPVDDFKEKK